MTDGWIFDGLKQIGNAVDWLRKKRFVCNTYSNWIYVD